MKTAGPFHNGIAFVSQASHHYGAIDKRGKALTPFIYDDINWFTDDTIRVTVGKEETILDKQFQPLFKLPGGCELSGKPTGGFCEFKMQNGKYRYWNIEAKRFIPGEFQYTSPFYFSKAVVSTANPNHFGVIDTDGNWVIKPHYNSLLACGKDRFIAGIAAVIR